MNIDLNFLRIPLYKLYYIDDVSNFKGLNKKELIALENEYEKSEIVKIISAISWGVSHPKYDFLSLLPNLPFSNEKIYTYLCALEKSFTKR